MLRIRHKYYNPDNKIKQHIYTDPEYPFQSSKPKPGNLYARKIRPATNHRSYTTINDSSHIFQYPADPV